MLHHLRLHQPARLCSASKNNIENKLRTFHGIQLLLLATQIHLIQQIHGRHLLKFPEGGVVKLALALGKMYSGQDKWGEKHRTRNPDFNCRKFVKILKKEKSETKEEGIRLI